MIFDWLENSRKVMKENALTVRDEWDEKTKYQQETAYVRYLMFHLRMAEGDIRGKWEALVNGSWVSIALDSYGKEKTYRDQICAAKRLGPLPVLPQVWITQGEIDYLNGLQAPCDVKRCWVRLLVYVKTLLSQGKRAVKKEDVDKWTKESAGMDDGNNHAVRRERYWSLRNGIPFHVKTYFGKDSAFSYYPHMPWMDKGDVICQVSLGDLKGIDALIDRKSFTCELCGRRFERSPRARSGLCDVCRSKIRRKKDAENHRRFRNKHKKYR